MADVNNTCKTCRFWHDQQIIGLCRRYPKVENKHGHEWCGEYAALLIDAVEIKTKRKYTRRQDAKAAA